MGSETETGAMSAAARFVGQCHGALEGFMADRQEVLELLDTLAKATDIRTARPAARQKALLKQFQPSVTVVGQVKAGKTALVNAMIGSPGLLPSDVNPWTSVVTSLHLRDTLAGPEAGACFTFFDEDDWDRLTRKGGRIGELAGRSGADDEAEKIRAQVAEMREKTKARLGRKFEMLLGTAHSYGSYSKDLVERYVCLGDESSPDAQGRFADITKAADLEVPIDNWPIPLCLRDTPGVNDTFMMREQITISALRDSRLCIVVLSAHQALSSVDMALIRLIANVQSREVVIFVNRVDELNDPSSQIPEIRESIVETLREQHGPEDVEILFGSAEWANAVLMGRIHDLSPTAALRLRRYKEAMAFETSDDDGYEDLAWQLSGVPDLYDAIWTRVTEGVGREHVQSIARQAKNLGEGLQAASEVDLTSVDVRAMTHFDPKALDHELTLVRETVLETYERAMEKAIETATNRLERSHRNFLDRATAALIQHLETFGEFSPWTYDPSGLRVLMRSGYQVFSRQARAAAEEAGQSAVLGVSSIYARLLDRPADEITLQSPVFSRLDPPILLGQTIALDLKGTWWRRWWSRQRGYAAFAEQFHSMIEAETRPIVEGLIESHCRPAQAAWGATLGEFFEDQKMVLMSLEKRIEKRDQSPPRRAPRGALRATVDRLGKHAA